MNEQTLSMLIAGGIGVGAIAVILLGVVTLIARFYKKVDQGRALIINPFRGEAKVSFTGHIVYPVVNRAEIMDISVKTIDIDRRGKDGLICKDNIRADISVTFFVQVNKSAADVLKVATLIGCDRASDQATIEQLFTAKFAEALKTVGKQLEFEQLYQKRDEFRQAVFDEIGEDLGGFELEDVAIDYLEQTPLESLDEQNILDAQGIRKITEITAQQNIHTNELRQKERMEIGAQNLRANEAIFEFEQREAEAKAKKEKEIASAQAREQNAAARIKDDEYKQTMMLRQKHEEEVAVAEEAKHRGVAIAQKNREREIAVETERVEKARALEEIGRQREVELGVIRKNKEVEVQKKEIADVVRQRVAVDKTVTEEQERIKDLELIADAKRKKEATVISAEAKAQEDLVKAVKAAEAQEQVARLEAKQKLTLAEASLEAADKEARAQMRLAEGAQAQAAAAGLAEVRVKEANAVAIEKEGLAQVRVKEAGAAALEKEGLAEAVVVREKMAAEAQGQEQQGLAEAKIKEALAQAIEKEGLAQAVAIEKKLGAEAAGLAEKATAMKALDGVGREHEEFRIRLEKDKEVELKHIEARIEVAEHQAKVMGEAMKASKINIVGGDGEFFDKFMGAVTLGQSADGMVNNSDTLSQLLNEYLTGQKSLPSDIKDVLTRTPVDSETIRNLSVSAILGKLMNGADDHTQRKIEELVTKAKQLGLD